MFFTAFPSSKALQIKILLEDCRKGEQDALEIINQNIKILTSHKTINSQHLKHQVNDQMPD